MYRSPLKSAILASGVYLIACSASAQSLEELEAELSAISGEISAAVDVVSSDESDAVKEVARLRLEVWRLSHALIQNRIHVVEGGESRRISVPVVEPDEQQAQKIRTELRLVADAINEATDASDAATGLERELARLRVETEKLTRSQLRLAEYQASFGIRLPGAGESASLSETEPELSMGGEVLDSPLVRRELSKGAEVFGWWTVSRNSPDTLLNALNFSAYRPDAGGDTGALLEIVCTPDEVNLAVLFPGESIAVDSGAGLEVLYSIDGESRLATWQGSFGGQGAVVSGPEAGSLLSDLATARMFEVEVWDVDNRLSAGQFQLDGISRVAGAAERDCSVGPVSNPVELARQDYRLVQTLLNIAGFDAGPADGIWGPRSQSAMRQYQVSAGLPQSGFPDREVLRLLGLDE